LISLADARKTALGALARALQPIPVDDGGVVLAVDAVVAHQAARRLAIDGVAGEDLNADDGKIVGEVPAAREQETGHRRAVDDSLPGPEVR
jgi:hypothetical protein